MEDLTGVQGTPEDLLQVAMLAPVTSTPVASQTVIDLGPDQDGAKRVTTRSMSIRYLSICSSYLLIFLSSTLI